MYFRYSVFALLPLLFACSREDNYVVQNDLDSDTEYVAMLDSLNLYNGISNFKAEIPKYLIEMGMQPPQIDNAKATLGRVLFYDKNLSADRSISCASCHRQQHAFSDVTAVSTGVFGRQTLRNSNPLANTANFQSHHQPLNGAQPLMFWDHRAENVQQQSAETFENPLEMGMPIDAVVDKVRGLNYYPYLWKEAYGNFNPTKEELLGALEEFVGAMSAGQTKFDQAMEMTSGLIPVNENNVPMLEIDTILTAVYYGTTTTLDTNIIVLPILVPGFSIEETRGLRLFVDNCSKCHSPIRPFQEVFAACNGLDMEYRDQGLGAITNRAEDMGVFKSPSLRNIALTAPYMHDGRFKTLEEVVEFYNSRVQPHPNLHPDMKQQLGLSPQDKKDLVAFLNTLTDNSVTKYISFSNPFWQ